MAGGLSYKTGRDMPPGMQEKFAVQIAQQLEETVTEAKQVVNVITEAMAFTCACCGAATSNSEEIGSVILHFCDSCTKQIEREVAWKLLGQTWKKTIVICPYCGYELDAEESMQFGEGDTDEHLCENCMCKFDVEVQTVRCYSTSRSVCEMPEDWQPPEENEHVHI